MSFCSRIYKRLADVELRTTLISLGKRGTLENLQIDALFQIVTKKSHSEVLMNRSSSELRQGLILVIQQRTFLSFSKVFL